MGSFQLNQMSALMRGIIFLLLIGLDQATFAQQARYNLSIDGIEVTDKKTGLIWKRCSQGQRWNGTTCVGSATELTHEQALGITKSTPGWRLPSVKELASIVDLRLLSPSIYPQVFPSTPASPFWTSTGYAGDSREAWIVDFANGSIRTFERKNTGPVRLVR